MSKPIQLNQFEREVLRFLWIWKASTTAGIHACVSPSRSIERVYRRLLAMENNSYIVAQSVEDSDAHVWTLDQRGFQLVESRLPRLIESGYKSEHLRHDILCHAIHVGDWLCRPPNGCDVFSEQQLRRIETDFYPAWVPKTPSHRPDGWWKVQSGNAFKLLALEVELSPKDIGSYENISEFYSELFVPEGVIWLVRDQDGGQYVHRHLRRANRSDTYVHSFIYLSDFIQHGWQSPIRIGKKAGEKLSSLLTPSPTLDTPQGVGQVLLDFRKKPIKPKGSRSVNPSEIL